ncbi:MAG TPA: alpha/beta hydrolase [Steroidobacter sp.]|nr:alpha/beta hydrolase [Steroidobacter sp.]
MYAEHTFFTRDGLTLFYRDYPGDLRKAPVLCLHGLTRNSQDFAKIAQRISPDRRVIAPDQRGRGRSQSDPNWLNYHPGVYVADMWSLLRKLDLERVIVIGTSLGGLMAILMAAMRPQAFAGVVLNDVGPELDPVGVARIQSYVGRLPPVKNWDEAVAQMKTMFAHALPDYTDAQWLQFARASFVADEHGAPRLASDPRIGDAVRAIPAPPGAAQAMWLAFGALSGVPTLALRGSHSDLLSAQTLERMRREHPRLVAVTVPNRGHPPQLDEPESVAALDAFLATITD